MTIILNVGRAGIQNVYEFFFTMLESQDRRCRSDHDIITIFEVRLETRCRVEVGLASFLGVFEWNHWEISTILYPRFDIAIKQCPYLSESKPCSALLIFFGRLLCSYSTVKYVRSCFLLLRRALISWPL